MKIIATIVIYLICLKLFGQQEKFTKYYDSLWQSTDKPNAFYYVEFEKITDGYNCLTYKAKLNTIYSKSIYTDTLLTKNIGIKINYYDNGSKKDSLFFDKNGTTVEHHAYYESGKLMAIYSYDSKLKKTVQKGYDENGKAIDNFIYGQAPEFPGGLDAWTDYLAKKLNTKIPVKNGAPKGKHAVTIQFQIDVDGKVINVFPITKIGFGMEEEAIRVINKSPKWKPAIYLGKKSVYRHQQNITFLVEEK